MIGTAFSEQPISSACRIPGGAKVGGKLDIVSRGDLLAYLNPVLRNRSQASLPKEKRVVDRDDLQHLLPLAIPHS